MSSKLYNIIVKDLYTFDTRASQIDVTLHDGTNALETQSVGLVLASDGLYLKQATEVIFKNKPLSTQASIKALLKVTLPNGQIIQSEHGIETFSIYYQDITSALLVRIQTPQMSGRIFEFKAEVYENTSTFADTSQIKAYQWIFKVWADEGDPPAPTASSAIDATTLSNKWIRLVIENDSFYVYCRVVDQYDNVSAWSSFVIAQVDEANSRIEITNGETNTIVDRNVTALRHVPFYDKTVNRQVPFFDDSFYFNPFGTVKTLVVPALNAVSGLKVGTLEAIAAGTFITDVQMQSILVTGTSPFSVLSTTLCSNLNADLLDGNHADAFALSGHTHSYSAHSGLSGLTSPADDHTQYVLLAGRTGGQTIKGDTAASGSLTLMSTDNETKGFLYFGSSCYNETDNRFGIGTQVPRYDAYFYKTSSGIRTFLMLHNYSGGTNDGSAIDFAVTANNSTIAPTMARITALRTSSPNSADMNMVFSIFNNGGLAEGMRLTPAGLGVGIAIPTTKLDVRLAGTAVGSVSVFGNTGDGSFGALSIDRTSWLFKVLGAGSVNLSLGANNTEYARLTTGGYFLINPSLTTAAKSLHVAGTTIAHQIQTDIGINFSYVVKPTIPTFALVAGAGLEIGKYYYNVVYTTALGDTELGTQGNVTTTTGNQQVTVTIPVSTDYRVTGRKIYRSKVEPTGNYYTLYLIATIANNTETTYTDSATDASLTGENYFFKINTTNVCLTKNAVRAAVLDTNLTSFGVNAGVSITTGGRNAFFGYSAGLNVTNGTDNSFFGFSAGQNLSTASGSCFFGFNAGAYSNVGSTCAFGYDALYYNVSGAGNVAIGAFSLFGVAANSHSYNTAVGGNSGRGITVGINNSFFGFNAGYANTTGSNGIHIGFCAGKYETVGSKLIIDSIDRTSEALSRSLGLIYGVFAAATANQYLTINGNVTVTESFTMADARNIVFNTTTGTKIGTGITQKLAFYNSTPIVQPSAIADATEDTASVKTQLNLLLAQIRLLGLIAT